MKKKKEMPLAPPGVISKLEKDPSFIQSEQQREQKFASLRKEYQKLSAPIMNELSAVGIVETSLDDLRRSGKKYENAIPILLYWLPKIENPTVKESIVRAVSVPWARPEAVETLLKEFKVAKNQSLKWAIGNALEVTADSSFIDDLMSLAEDPKNGTARQMIVLGLGKMKDMKVVPLLQYLLMDDEVAGHAIAALGRLKSQDSVPLIEKFLDHKNAWIRKEARTAIVKIQKASNPRR